MLINIFPYVDYVFLLINLKYFKYATISRKNMLLRNQSSSLQTQISLLYNNYERIRK